QPDGSYVAELYRGGVVPVPSLSGVVIDLDALLDGWAGNSQSFASYYVGGQPILEIVTPLWRGAGDAGVAPTADRDHGTPTLPDHPLMIPG
ncbi:MAG: hypothetical protein K0S78_5929, partial [Thermomicrobiales bacterium]|nr:hypothetical protein [Thermomicrobiales bacterium]